MQDKCHGEEALASRETQARQSITSQSRNQHNTHRLPYRQNNGVQRDIPNSWILPQEGPVFQRKITLWLEAMGCPREGGNENPNIADHDGESQDR